MITENATLGFLTISDDAQDCQVDLPLPVRALLQGNPVACGGEDITTSDGHKLAPLISTSHVVQHSSIIYESIQFPARPER